MEQTSCFHISPIHTTTSEGYEVIPSKGGPDIILKVLRKNYHVFVNRQTEECGVLNSGITWDRAARGEHAEGKKKKKKKKKNTKGPKKKEERKNLSFSTRNFIT